MLVRETTLNIVYRNVIMSSAVFTFTTLLYYLSYCLPCLLSPVPLFTLFLSQNSRKKTYNKREEGTVREQREGCADTSGSPVLCKIVLYIPRQRQPLYPPPTIAPSLPPSLLLVLNLAV